MTRPTAELKVPENVTLEGLKAPLSDTYGFHEEPESPLQRTYLDTFDWRVHDSGHLIEAVSDGKSYEVILRQRAGLEIRHRVRCNNLPGFADAFPAGGLRKQLARVLAMRKLLPLVKVESTLQTLRVLGDEDKTVVRLELERARFVSADGERDGDLGLRIHLVPVRGYDADFDRVRAALEARLKPADLSLYDAAVSAIGRVPGDYTSKLNYKLNPRQRADRSAKLIHLGLLRTLEANIEGTLGNVDSEFLHDLRVATRRARSALTQMKNVLPLDVVERFKVEFAWVGNITGPTRDLDVYLLALEDYKSDLPSMLQGHLDPLRGFLDTHHEQAQKALARHLGGSRFRKLLRDWRTYLEAPVPNVAFEPNAVRPIKEVADERIWKMYRRVLKEGRGIGEASPAEDLHELRKSCKKLRYLMEFFENLYPDRQVRTLVKVLKTLLDNLGNFQDLEVQALHLRRFGEQMAEEDHTGADTLLAMGALIGSLTRRQALAREHFAEIFAGFDTREHRLLFKALFKTDGEAAP